MKFLKLPPVVLIAICVWTAWILALAPAEAFSYIGKHWQATVTMLFGSLVAGSTSLGGGAVAFPVFTKILHVPAFDAKVFSLMIQSVGMGAATVLIIIKRIKVEWQIILASTISGAIGIFAGSYLLAPIVSPEVVKMLFTMILTSFGVTLLILNVRKEKRHAEIPVWSSKERTTMLIAGGVGGLLSGLHGSGIDIVTFSVMVLLFRMSEKIATPTSVVIMAFNAMVGALLHNFVFNDAAPLVVEYWYAAIPVVVVGAPLGVVLCSLLRREIISNILLFMIMVELVSTLIIIPVQLHALSVSLIALLIFSSINILMLRSKTYQYPGG